MQYMLEKLIIKQCGKEIDLPRHSNMWGRLAVVFERLAYVEESVKLLILPLNPDDRGQRLGLIGVYKIAKTSE